ncbi:IS701 family transposase [Streptomyces sp. NBC_00212]|uniref:IS701 family transposase n=1 Tax=Streptomyces sp. NBC_00212 TaxID=2975684 RepID=UPI0032451D83
MSAFKQRAIFDDVVGELSAALFSSFRRKDQRHKAETYLHGLLTTVGRKTIRNIAAQVGGPADTEQSLHHFISSSPWDWRPVRAALTDYLEQMSSPQAWVVRAMQIPKGGEYSVGVDRIFAPHLGEMFRGQQAFGVWLASEELSAPVNWRMLLPDQWVSDPERRGRAGVPDGARPETPDECAVAAVLDTAQYGSPARRPVVIDLRRGDPHTAMPHLTASGVPVLARISSSCRVTVADRALPGFGAGALPARRILEAVKGLRRPVSWADPAAHGATRTSLVAAIPVSFPSPEGVRPRPLLLLGEWLDPSRPPVQLWLTDLTQMPMAALLRLTKLTHRVDRDFAHVGTTTGLLDYAGRSFQGWHRHITLASAAHAAHVLTAENYVMGRAA